MPTPTEREILRERRARKTGMILVPILEELLSNQVEPRDEEDFRFLDHLVRARAVPREKGVFSPSMLGSCMRQAFFAATGVPKHTAQSSQTNGYFLKGNFVHLQWQFALWKAHRAGLLRLVTVPAEKPELDFYGDGTRPAVELRVKSARGDYAGTIDAIIAIKIKGKWRYFVVDFKGINLIDYQRAMRDGAKYEYRIQIVGYAMIVNGTELLPFVVKDCLLVSECKAGPVSGSGSPIALHETMVNVDDHKAEVLKRLGKLRGHVAQTRTPAPACQSTRHLAFQECPFNRLCLDEVRVVQREREREARKSRKPFNVARPTRRED